MPYIEQDNVEKLWQYPSSSFNNNRGVTGNQATVSWRVIPTFICPSAPINPVDTESDGASSPPRHWALTCYMGNAGRRNYRRADQTNDGPFIHNQKRKIADITDGTSNTAFVGERGFVDPVFDSTGDSLRFWGWYAFGAEGDVLLSAAERINWKMPNPPTQANYDLRINVFGSSHTGGANFAFGDGSVRYMTDSTDLLTLQRLCMHQDGAVVTLP